MKGLTLTAPWGSLIAVADAFPDDGKHIETRGPFALHWKYRGLLAIHQAVNLAPVGGLAGLATLIRTPPFWMSLNIGGYALPSLIPLGKIVAVANLIEIASITEDGIATSFGRLYPQPPEHDFGDYTPGRAALLLAEIRALPRPVACRGAQGLWTVPADVQMQIADQLKSSNLEDLRGLSHGT